MSSNILIIKLGALGDMVQALGPMEAIRKYHAGDRITLLTTAPFAEFAMASSLIDEVWTDNRPSFFQFKAWLRLRRFLRRGRFRRVYDLQTSDRTGWYYRLLGPGVRPEWSGIAPGCSHPHANPCRNNMHTIDRQREQLGVAGIREVPDPSLDWAPMQVDIDPGGDLALIVPGGAIHRPRKRWPVERYAGLARNLVSAGMRPILVGNIEDSSIIAAVTERVDTAVNLSGRTSLLQLAGLCRRAQLAVGNDTGPMHMAVTAGVPSVVLYSNESDPRLCGQRGPVVEFLRCRELEDLSLNEVTAAVTALTIRSS